MLLLTGIVLNIFISMQIGEVWQLWLLGNIPAIVLFLLQIWKNRLLLDTELKSIYANPPKNKIISLCTEVLQYDGWKRFPVLAILMLPLLIILDLILLLFGQQPDSFIRAFTDTYQQGFSQLNYMCDNVNCGGHFLCSVAANGHKKVVHPIRYGERNGNKIICNRQLLVANAFEELIQNRFPLLHKYIRKKYNTVGDLIHRYYGVFNNKLVADIVYVMMKPLEWLFLIVLYAFHRKPENLIAMQYKIRDRKELLS